MWSAVPWRVAAYRIVARHARASLAGTNRHPGLGKLVLFLRWTHGYYTDTSLHAPAPSRALTAQQLRPHGARLVRRATPAQAANFLASRKPVRSSDADPP